MEPPRHHLHERRPSGIDWLVFLVRAPATSTYIITELSPELYLHQNVIIFMYRAVGGNVWPCLHGYGPY